MKNFKKVVLLLLFVSGLTLAAQTPYTDKTAGFSVNIPDGWTHEKHEEGELALRCKDSSGTSLYDVNLRKLDEGVTAKDHVLYLESLMADKGYSANFMDENARDITGADAKAYNADDIFGGAYSVEKDGVMIVQMIFVYRKGRYAYMTVQTTAQDKIGELQSQYNVFYTSFKLL
jgi:hypothetical protein